MTLTRVESSMVYAVGYDPSAWEMDVVFRNGSIYRYAEISPQTFDELMAADSIGHFMNTRIIGRNPSFELTDHGDETIEEEDTMAAETPLGEGMYEDLK
jgi:hypothetical protein